MNKQELEQLDDRGMEAWNNHDTEGWLSLFADNFTWQDWTLPEPIRDKEGARQYFTGWMTAFSDFRVKTTNRVVGDDAVASEVEFTGTNDGPLAMGGMELPATNKMMTARGSYIARVRDGKIVEFSSHPDAAGMMMQLGMMPQK
jgi:steroid delta-isomerase-like uncharacterized protein